MENTILLVYNDDLSGLETKLVCKELDGGYTLLTKEQMKSSTNPV